MIQILMNHLIIPVSKSFSMFVSMVCFSITGGNIAKLIGQWC